MGTAGSCQEREATFTVLPIDIFGRGTIAAELTKIFGNDYENLIRDAYVDSVEVHSILSSTPEQRRIASKDLHYFVLLTSNLIRVHLTLEKYEGKIYIGKCHDSGTSSTLDWKNAFFLTNHGRPHYLPSSSTARCLVKEKSHFKLSLLIKLIENLKFNYLGWNSQQFAKIIFDELAKDRQDDFFKMLADSNVAEKVFGNNFQKLVEGSVVTDIAVYKTPLDGIYRKSNESIREAIGRQWTSVDYHAFVVLRSSRGICLSFEKQQDGVYIGRSPWYDHLVHNMGESPRKAPVELVIKDKSDYPLARLMRIIESEKSAYSATDDNCQHFAKRLFDKVALEKRWEFTRPYKFICKLLVLLIILVIVIPHIPYLLYLLLNSMQVLVHNVAFTIYYIFHVIYSSLKFIFNIFVYIFWLVIFLLFLDHYGCHILPERYIDAAYRFILLGVVLLLLLPWLLKVIG